MIPPHGRATSLHVPGKDAGGDAPLVSVLLPTKNAGPLLDRVLDQVFRQEAPFAFELVVVDSGSTDGTIERILERPARLYRIPPGDFNHGETRNLLARLARGQYLVFLTQDALPANERWLAELVRPLVEGEASGSYARQVPRVDTDPLNRFFLAELYPPTGRTQRYDGVSLALDDLHFSNASSAMTRAAWEARPFRSDIIMAEDQDWSARTLASGETIRYVAEAVVEHAHHYRMRETFRRYFDSGVSYREIFETLSSGQGFGRLFAAKGLRHVARKVAYLWRNGHAAWILPAALESAVKALAVFLGSHHRLLPVRVKQALSHHRYHWDQNRTPLVPAAPNAASPAKTSAP